MAKPNVVFLYNNSTGDGANTGGASGGAGGSSSNWVVMDTVNDKLLFLDSQQLDGDSNSGATYPVIIPAAGSIEAPKTFVNDDSASVFDQVPLAGTTDGDQSGGNTRYVFCVHFDGATAGIPYLEAWNDNTHAAANDDFLGGGTPANSTLKAIATTNAVPGSATWSGTPLSGTDSRIALDTGALAGAKALYFNAKQSIASTFTPQSDTSIVLACRFLYS
jgi:hypothetical protein